MPSNTAISPAKAARLTRRRKLETVTATKAQKAFAELLQTMRRKPVVITRKGKPAAVVMSARRYRDLMQLFAEMEDRIWLKLALEAKKEGLAPRKQSDALLRKLREK